MSRYIANGSIAVGTNKTAAILGASSTCHPKCTYLNMSTDGIPAGDQGCIISVQRATALGTTTPVTPGKMDPADVPAIATFGSNATVEPTYGGAVMTFAMNPRTTFQWAAYDKDARIVVAAASNNGLGVQMTAAGNAVGNLVAIIGWDE